MFSAKIKTMDRETYLVSIIFLIPSLIFMILFIFYPIFDSFILSLYSWNGIDPVKTFVGIENWKALITDIRFWRSLKNNILILVLSILIQMPVAIFLALAMDYIGRKFNFLRSIYYLPMLMSSVAIGFLFRYAYDPQFGIVAGILNIFKINITIDILGNPNISMFAIIAVICWQFIPFYFILYVASISSIPIELYEAAKIDGSTYFNYATRRRLRSRDGAKRLSPPGLALPPGLCTWHSTTLAPLACPPGTTCPYSPGCQPQ